MTEGFAIIVYEILRSHNLKRETHAQSVDFVLVYRQTLGISGVNFN